MIQNQFIVTTDPSFADLALAEVQIVTPSAATVSVGEGVWLVTGEKTFWEIAETWRQQPPIFVRHICPVQQIVGLRNKIGSDQAILRQAINETIMPLVDPELPLSVQTRILTASSYKPFDINKALADYLQKECNVAINVRTPQQILSVVCTPPATRENPLGASLVIRHSPLAAYLGLSPTTYNLSDWAGGKRRFAREKGQVSRAEFKLLEALEVFAIELPPRGVALDLGASPGGWSRVLRQRQQYITAIDPGDLDPRLAQDPAIRHKRMTAEAYLADEPDTFDLIVNDMRMDARDSARLMVDYAQQLYPQGSAIMTLKLPEQNRRLLIEHAFTILQEAYTIAGARQLFHNRSEITLYLVRRTIN